MPKELWGDDDDEGLNFATSLVGDPLMMDEAIKLRKRIDYARTCIMISANKELKSKIVVDVGRTTTFKVAYEGILGCCSNCKVFGRAITSCTTRRSSNVIANSAEPTCHAVGSELPVVHVQEVSSSNDFIFGGRNDISPDAPSRVENSLSSSNTCQGEVDNVGKELPIYAPRTEHIIEVLNGDGSTTVLIEEDNTVVQTSPNRF